MLSFILGVSVIAVSIFVSWRLVSRRHFFPCPVWLRWLVEMDNPFTKTTRAAVIIEHLDVKAGMSVIDVGCGPGRVSIPLAKQVGPGGKVVAMDVQEGMLKRAKEKVSAADVTNIEFLQAGAGQGKLGREQFDRALLVTVLGEIPEREAALREIFNALKPGGILPVTEMIFDPYFQSRKTVARLAGEAGFKEKDFFGNRIAFTLNLEKPY